MTNKYKAIDPRDLPAQSFEWGATKWLVAPGVTPGANMSFGEVAVLPGRGHDRHNHPDSEEILYFLSGEGMQMVGDEEPFPVGPGDTIYIPAGVFHSTVNTGWGLLRVIAIYNPAGPEKDLEGLPDFLEVAPGEAPRWGRSS
ncbi:MAG: cupin domain-containing protein [Chloroflexota bacterium]|nr:cupin domain-containing protein [Chloroflexota bacterium]